MLVTLVGRNVALSFPEEFDILKVTGFVILTISMGYIAQHLQWQRCMRGGFRVLRFDVVKLLHRSVLCSSSPIGYIFIKKTEELNGCS